VQWVSIWDKLIGAGTEQTALSGQHEILWIGGEGFGNQGLADLWSIRFSGINQGDPQLLRALQDSDCRILIRW
jgi:hypothetical protein